MTEQTRARLGSAPDSWGIWFPSDPQQTPATRFLDEIAAAGYKWMELGPYGYLPTDPAELSDELAKRDLKVTAGTVGFPLHKKDRLKASVEEAVKVANLAAAVGGTHIVLMPDMYRDLQTGDYLESKDLDIDGWKQLIAAGDEIGRAVAQETGLRVVFHPHADTHVETEQQTRKWLDDSDSEHIGLCLDTGHIAYRHGDNVALMREYSDRVEYMHFKQVDPEKLAVVDEQDLGFKAAVAIGAIATPPAGVPKAEDIAAEMHLVDPDIVVIVEQDMYPCSPDRPLPIATRTCAHLREVGLAV